MQTDSDCLNIDLSAMCSILMDLAGLALQTNEKLYQNFRIIF